MMKKLTNASTKVLAMMGRLRKEKKISEGREAPLAFILYRFWGRAVDDALSQLLVNGLDLSCRER